MSPESRAERILTDLARALRNSDEHDVGHEPAADATDGGDACGQVIILQRSRRKRARRCLHEKLRAVGRRYGGRALLRAPPP